MEPACRLLVWCLAFGHYKFVKPCVLLPARNHGSCTAEHRLLVITASIGEERF
jgi:hypothetical protein